MTPQRSTLPSSTNNGVKHTRTPQDDAVAFKSTFRDLNSLGEQTKLTQSQIIKIMRREAATEHGNNICQDEIQKLKVKQKHLESQLHKVDKVDILQTQVLENTNRLEEHSKAINRQADTIENVLGTLQELKVSTERQEEQTKQQYDTILKEIWK